MSGAELGPLLHEQAEAAGAEFVLDTVEGIAVDGDWRVVTLRVGDACGRAPSSSPPARRCGRWAFPARSNSSAAACRIAPPATAISSPARRSCVIGGGDSALDEALVLAEHAARVTIIHRGASLRRAAGADRSRRRQRQDRDRASNRGRGDRRR